MNELNSAGLPTAVINMRVPFYDVDLAGIVWHGHYLKYFELARCALLEAVGYSYMEMQDSGFLWPVVDTSIRYVNPLVLEQHVSVTACLKEWELRIVVDYEIHDAQGALCTRGKTVQVPVDAKTKLLQLGSPELLINNVQRYIESHKDDG
jgi:acyl-CoA thioester hydrolase